MISFTQIVLANNNIESKIFNITLKIRGTGDKYIFSPYIEGLYSFPKVYYPNIIYINGENQSTINNHYNFNQTDNLVQLIWYNNIDNCKYMFWGCKDITEIDLFNFNASKVTNMWSMFRYCSSLSSLNLSNFDTSNVMEMGEMFSDCSSLTSLNLTHFDTSKVTYMGFMFSDCSSLTSLNLTNFDTSNVRSMDRMFYGCSSLSSLNLSNFNTSKVSDMYFMFWGCSKLEYINLKNFVEKNTLSVKAIFYNVPINIVICLNENSSKISGEIKEKPCYTFDCSDNWNLKQKKIVNKKGICYDNKNKDILYNYEYEGKYYEKCLNGYLINNSSNISCKCNSAECYSCSNISNNEYYEIENDNNVNGYIKCYKNPMGYYLDKNIYKYKKCYYRCKECEIGGNNITHNCLTCKDNYTSILNNNNYSNCYIDKNTESTLIPFSQIPTTEIKIKTTNEIITSTSMTKDSIINNINPINTITNIEEKHVNNTSMEKKNNVNDTYIYIFNSSYPYEYPELLIETKKCIKTKELKALIEEIIKTEKKETNTKKGEIEYYNTILKYI